MGKVQPRNGPRACRCGPAGPSRLARWHRRAREINEGPAPPLGPGLPTDDWIVAYGRFRKSRARGLWKAPASPASRLAPFLLLTARVLPFDGPPGRVPGSFFISVGFSPSAFAPRPSPTAVGRHR